MILAVLVGGLEAWLTRNDMYSDGISYLDLGDAVFRGDWHSALNAYWSPLYPILLGSGMSLLKPNAIWEFPVVHLVNFIIFACTVVAFQYMLSGFLRVRSDSLPEWLWTALGYSVFLWSALRLIGVGLVSPDMCVAAFVFLATGILLRIKKRPSPWRYAVLGLVIGLGYLAKAPLLPIGVLMLAIGALLAGGVRKAASRLLVAVAAFFAIAGIWIFGLSIAAHRLSFGESWRLNFVWYVNDIPRYHWHGPGALHPTHKVFENPPAYEFNARAGGTYPVWFDPAYWNAGIQPQLAIPQMLRQIRVNILDYYELFFHTQVAIVAICFGLFLLCGAGRKNWILLIPPAAALVMYAPVHVEDRMVGAYVVLLWLGLFSSIRIANSDQRRSAYYLMLALTILEVSRLGLSVLGTAASHGSQERSIQAEIAQSLDEAGLHEHDKVAWVRPKLFTPAQNYWWARLGKLQIIAEVPIESSFWEASIQAREQLVAQLRTTGAKAIIVTSIPAGTPREGWMPVSRHGYFMRLFED